MSLPVRLQEWSLSCAFPGARFLPLSSRHPEGGGLRRELACRREFLLGGICRRQNRQLRLRSALHLQMPRCRRSQAPALRGARARRLSPMQPGNQRLAKTFSLSPHFSDAEQEKQGKFFSRRFREGGELLFTAWHQLLASQAVQSREHIPRSSQARALWQTPHARSE